MTSFKLTEARVRALSNAGISSINDLNKVAQALDLKVTIHVDPDYLAVAPEDEGTKP